MAELSYTNPIETSSTFGRSDENISSRRKVVYKTLIEPTVARLEAEKNKHKLFLGLLFRLNSPGEIAWVSTEKYYEPFLTANGRYTIDYYRKSEYTVKIDKEVSEVILLDNTFIPKKTDPSKYEQSVRLQGEERIVRTTNAFVFLNKVGKELRISDFQPAASEENSEELIESLDMQDVSSNLDIGVMKRKILLRPNDISRLVSESLEIDERSIIYRPIYKVTYKCARLGKVAHLEIDGLTSKVIRHENPLVAAAKAMLQVFRIKN